MQVAVYMDDAVRRIDVVQQSKRDGHGAMDGDAVRDGQYGFPLWHLGDLTMLIDPVILVKGSKAEPVRGGNHFWRERERGGLCVWRVYTGNRGRGRTGRANDRACVWKPTVTVRDGWLRATCPKKESFFCSTLWGATCNGGESGPVLKRIPFLDEAQVERVNVALKETRRIQL